MEGTVVAVTGASGYIGSHVCKNLVEHGYTVRACVRDKSRHRTQHLLRMNDSNNEGGSLELHSADMMDKGSYDAIFDGCVAVFHVAGNFGTDPRWASAAAATAEASAVARPSPIDEALGTSTAGAETKSYNQGVYDSYVVSMQNILDSIKRCNTVKRLIFTSSGCAGPCVCEEDQDDDYTVQDNAYGKGKVDCEKLMYVFGEEHGIICSSCCPHHVLGPILAPIIHDMTYQHRLGEMFAGKYCLTQGWEIADVRDVADTQRLMLESSNVKNGSRYYNTVPPREELSAAELVAMLQMLFPNQAEHIAQAPENNESDGSLSESGSVSGEGYESDSESEQGGDWASTRTSRWMDPEKELGLHRHAVEDTVRDTILSMQELSMIDRQDVSTQELRDFYNVAEMDGCKEEMEYILTQLKQRG